MSLKDLKEWLRPIQVRTSCCAEPVNLSGDFSQVEELLDEVTRLAAEHDVLWPLLRFLELSIADELLYSIASNTVPAPDAHNRKIVVEPTDRFRVLCAALRTGETDRFIELLAGYGSHEASPRIEIA